MKISPTVLLETKRVGLGVLLGDVLICAVFALLHKFNYTVPLGALLGTVCAVGNFFLLGVSIQKGLDMGDAMQKYLKSSYALRMLMHLACIALAALLPCFHLIATIIPLFFPRLTILGMQLLGLYKPEKKNKEKGGDEP